MFTGLVRLANKDLGAADVGPATGGEPVGWIGAGADVPRLGKSDEPGEVTGAGGV